MFVWWSRRRRRLVRSEVGVDALVDVSGTVTGRIAPGSAGQVRVGGELWRARADVPLAPGAVVRVRAVAGLELEVEPGEERAGC